MRSKLLWASATCLTIVLVVGTAVSLCTTPLPPEQWLISAVDSVREHLFGGKSKPFGHIMGMHPLAVLFGVLVVMLLLLRPKRDMRLVAFAALTPVSAVLVTDKIFKPLFITSMFRAPGHYLAAFPSGHTTGSVALGLMVWISLQHLPGTWSGWSRPVGAVIGCIPGAFMSCVVLLAKAHLPFDVIGGWAVAAGTTAFWSAVLLEDSRERLNALSVDPMPVDRQ